MVVTTYSKFDAPGAAASFAISRLSKIYPPYWVLTILLTLYWLKSPGSVNSEHGGVDLVGSYLLTPSETLPLVPVAWTLTYELMFYAFFFAFIAALPRKLLPAALVGWSAVVLAGYLALHTVGGGNAPAWVGTAFSPFVLEFCAGCFIGLAFKTSTQPLRYGWVAIGVALAALLAMTLLYDLIGLAETPLQHVRVAIFGPISALLIYGLAALADKPAPRLAVMMGDASYSLYLVHILVMHAGYRFLLPRFDSFIGSVAVFVGVTALSIVVGIAFFWVVEKPLTYTVRKFLEHTRTRYFAPA